MKPEPLLLHVLDELRQLVNNRNEYSGIRASKLLRQILLDGYPLLDQANRILRLKIHFPVGNTLDRNPLVSEQRSTIFSAHFEAFYPLPGTTPTLLNRNDFLKLPVFVGNGRSFSVKQLIEHTAHLLGGVHSGEAKTQTEKALNAIHDLLSFNNEPAILNLLFPVCLVVLDALEPLKIGIIMRYGQNAHKA